MEASGLSRSRRMFRNTGSVENGMVGLEPQNPHHRGESQQARPRPSTASTNHRKMMETQKNKYPVAPQPVKPAGSEEEDEEEHGKRKASCWQRMKWTDQMVRLLIVAVYYIGDEVGAVSEADKISTSNSNMLQKKGKGKWKSVSLAMVEKGHRVSPQQCEDKFNDLNKRYKRVNDILGRGGIACKVVENQALLETMDHISPSNKEELRKLLNSKQLFYREMCAYHHSFSPAPHRQDDEQTRYHSTDPPKPNSAEDDHVHHHDESDSDYDDDHHEEGEEDVDSDDDRLRWKRARGESGSGSSPPLPLPMVTKPQLPIQSEKETILADRDKSASEKKEWLMLRLLQLEDERVKYQNEALAIEKQRLKWIKFSCNKEREIERLKIDNQRKSLDIQRMLLFLRQKEIEMCALETTHKHQPQHHPTPPHP